MIMMMSFNLEEPIGKPREDLIGYPAQPGLIRQSVSPSVVEKGTSPTDLVNHS